MQFIVNLKTGIGLRTAGKLCSYCLQNQVLLCRNKSKGATVLKTFKKYKLVLYGISA